MADMGSRVDIEDGCSHIVWFFLNIRRRRTVESVSSQATSLLHKSRLKLQSFSRKQRLKPEHSFGLFYLNGYLNFYYKIMVLSVF